MKKLDFSNRVHKVQCPTLVIGGEKDNANIKSAHYLAENIENAKLKIMKRAYRKWRKSKRISKNANRISERLIREILIKQFEI